jgi:methionine synthase II (cobalamin-independent)
MGELRNKGFYVIDLHEPAIAYYKDIDWNLISKLYTPIIKEGYVCWVYIYFGGVVGKISGLARTRVDKVSIDIYQVSLRELESLLYEELILGVLDAQNTLLEDVNRIRGICESISKMMDLERLILSSNTHMEYLPYDVANQKVRLLGRLLRELI